MEKRKVVSRIRELQNSAAKTSTLESQNDDYAKRTTEMQDEIKKLRSSLKQVEVEKNTFERDIAIYIAENKNLNQQLTVLKSSNDNTASTAARFLHEIKDGNKKLMTLREEEYKANLDRLKDKVESSDAEWSEKVKSIEKKNFTLRGEKRDLEKKAESLQSELDMHKTKAQSLTTNHESTKQNLMKKSAEVQELNKAVKELETKLADAENERSSKSMKSKIQVQAIEAKLQRAEEERSKLKEAHTEELMKLKCQLEEREKQLGAQSNISKRMKTDLKSEADSVKEDLKVETEKNKELTTQITRLEIKIKASSEHTKHLDEENKVKLKCFEEQIAVLQKEVTAKSMKMEELKTELYQTHHTNSDELQDFRNKIVILKTEKRNALNKNTEVIEELESLKKGLNRELESMAEAHKQEIEKLKRESREKEKHAAAQACVTRKIQEDVKRQLESRKDDLENEKLCNGELNKEIKNLEFKLRNAQDSVKSVEDDNSLKLRLAEEKVSALQQEMTIKNRKMHELQKQVLDAQDMNGKDIEELTEKLSNAKREKRAAQERISELMEENNRLERMKSKAEISGKGQKGRLESISLELEDMEKKCKNLDDKCVELQNDLDLRDSSLRRLKEEILQLKARKRSLESENKVKENLDCEVSTLKKKLSALETEAKQTEVKLKADIRAAEKEVNDMELEYKEQINDLQEKLSETQRKLASKNITSVTMCKRVEEDYQKQLQEIESREKENAANLKNELKDVRKELEMVKHELQKQVLDAQDMNGKDVEELTDKLSNAKREKRAAQERISELMNDLDLRDSSLQRMKEEILQLKARKRSLESENKAKEDLACEVSTLKKKLSALEMEAKQTEVKLKADIRSAEKEVNDVELEYKEQINDLQGKLSETQRKLASKNITSVTMCKRVEEDYQKQLEEIESREKENAGNLKNELKDVREELEMVKHELQKQVLEAQDMNGKDVEELTEKLSNAKREKRAAQERISELMNDLDLRDSSLQRMKEEISQLKARKRSLESENKAKEDLDCEVSTLRKKLSALETEAKQTEVKLKADIRSAEKEVNDVELEYKEQINDLQEKLSETQRKLASKNITSVTMCKRVEEDYQKQLQEIESREKGNAGNLKNELEDVRKELEMVKEAKAEIEEKFDVMRESCSVIETMEEHLEDYHEKCQQLQERNSDLIEKLAVAAREKGNVDRNVEERENESAETSEKVKQQEKALETLKQTCVMLEEQVVDLEKFNDELFKNQNELTEEKENATKELREVEKKLCEVEDSITLEKRRGLQLEENNTEEIIELQVKVREEANTAQELHDELSDLDRKYKLLDMHANALQKKLNNEKENTERLRFEADGYRSRMETLESVRHQTSSGLRSEVERADALAHEKTALQNEMDTFKMKHSHECIKLNCTIGQQSKLIDFLQSKVEALEPHDKKKKKKKNDLYQVPLQYRELQDMLEESKQTNIQLQQKVNDLRTELQNAKSEVSRLKHGINGATATASSNTLSPGSIAAISSLMKSPNLSSPLTGNSRSKARMHHNIPHRLTENLCTHATKCAVCLDSVRFGRVSIKCTECNTWCHVKCRSNMTSSCGLPGGLVQHYKQGGKIAMPSPVSCISANDGDGNVQGWLKVFCGGSSWEKKWIQFRDGVMIMSNSEKPITSSKRIKIDVNNKDREVIDLVHQQGYVHATVLSSELEISAKADIPYVFKLELGPDTSCWPPRNLYFLSSGFTDKQKWVAALEAITTRNSSVQNTINDSKVIGNKILVMQATEKLEINCSLPISKEKVLFGCDEGLFVLSPSTSSICDRSQLMKVGGTQQMLQMDFLKSPNLIVAIEGAKRRVVTFDVQNLISSSGRPFDLCVKLIPVEDLLGCHLLAIGSVEGAPHLCSASAASIQIHRFNTQLGKFVKRTEIATTEPCTCLQFTMCSIIMGTDKFYEIELKSYKVDEFLNTADRSLIFDFDSFPVAVLQIGENNGKQEYLLCYHEFGVFVDCFGKRTRKDNVCWSRLPLSFAYKSPYLIVTHFYSVEILRIARSSNYDDDNFAIQQAYLNLPSPRYLGPAITEGAVYLSANEGGKISIFCAKGNMQPLNAKENNDGETVTPKSCLKRRKMHLAASSQESLEDVGSAAKRTQRSPSIESSSALLSDTTNFSASCESLLSSNTSRWTDKSKMLHFPPDAPQTSIPKKMRTASYDSLNSLGTTSSENTMYSKYSEDDAMSSHSGASSKMMWKPVTPGSGRKQTPEKPARKNKTTNKRNFEPFEI